MNSLDTLPPELLMERSGDVSVYYAPVDYTNKNAKIVICGITPGLQQALLSLQEVNKQLNLGASFTDAKISAKNVAGFAGPMRNNLVRLLDYVGIAEKLGIDSSDQLFGGKADLAHLTSALRYPVFVSNKNYNGTPSMITTPILRNQLDLYLLPQLEQLGNDTIYVPLGPKVEAALQVFVKSGIIRERQLLSGFPHPSGANSERIAYFLKEKTADKLSTKTNAHKIDAARENVIVKMASWDPVLT